MFLNWKMAPLHWLSSLCIHLATRVLAWPHSNKFPSHLLFFHKTILDLASFTPQSLNPDPEENLYLIVSPRISLPKITWWNRRGALGGFCTLGRGHFTLVSKRWGSAYHSLWLLIRSRPTLWYEKWLKSSIRQREETSPSFALPSLCQFMLEHHLFFYKR